MQKNILIVDDERDIVEMIQYNLSKAGFKVSTAFSGEEALSKALSVPDLLLLDVMLPDIDGWEVCRRLKRQERTASIPIIFLTARGTEIDEVVGLELGAEDYIAKPISMAKLLARIRSVFRLKEKQGVLPQDRDILRIGAMEIDASNHLAKIDETKLQLTKKEFQTLFYLASHCNRVISRETLLSEVWGSNVHVTERTVDVHIRKIREKLGSYATHIETLKGVGYRFRSKAV